MIKVTNLTIEYNKLLFKNLSFILGNKEKVGLIGLNGCGKSTLLKILADIEIPDKGSIELVNESLAYLPQEYSFKKGTLVGEILEGLVDNPKREIYKVNKILNNLNFLDVNWYQEVQTLSYGQKMKLYLTTLLIKEPTILLLDEPTNHLDIFGILWLENFIKNFDGICIMVSHDRAFLNNITNKIFEIDEQSLNIFEGNYDDYLDQKKGLIAHRRKLYIQHERHREKLVNLIKRIGEYNPGEKQGRALGAAKHRLIREVLNKEIVEYKEQKIKNLSIKGETHKNKLILKVKNLDFGYGDKAELLMDANFDMFGKEKIWFYGSNGIGKSTLIKLIAGELKASSGQIKIGENVRWTYFSQDQSHLPMEETVEEYFLKNTSTSYSASFSKLEKFLFTKDMRNIKIGKLSPGERARLSFAIFSQKEYEFLILDEPTNHLDIKSKEIIEDALREYQGAILLISHDRYFVESVGMDRCITIEDRKIKEVKI